MDGSGLLIGRVAIGVLFLVMRWCVLGAIITVAGAVGLLELVTSGVLPTRRGSSVGGGVALLLCMAGELLCKSLHDFCYCSPC